MPAKKRSGSTKKSINKKSTSSGVRSEKIDIFQKAYETMTTIVKKSVDILQDKFDEIVKDVKKQAVYFGLLALIGLFVLFGIAEFLGNAFPWYGRTIGYLTVAAVLGIVAMFYKSGME